MEFEFGDMVGLIDSYDHVDFPGPGIIRSHHPTSGDELLVYFPPSSRSDVYMGHRGGISPQDEDHEPMDDEYGHWWVSCEDLLLIETTKQKEKELKGFKKFARQHL